MSQREALKKVTKFGKREYAEKKPLSLKVLRVKSKSILKRGILPSLNIKQIQGTFFIIIADYGDYLRIYSFGRDGQLFGGENIEKNPKFMKELTNSTALAYHLPKVKHELSIEDITKQYIEEFDKALQRTNKLFGFNLKRPYTIIAHENLKLRMGRMIGVAKTRNEDKLVISPDIYKKEEFEAIITREIMYLYLRDLIVMFQDIQEEVVYWYDLAILFTNFYLRNEKSEYLRNIMERSTFSFLNFNDGSKYYFSDKVLETFKANTKSYTTQAANLLLSNIFNCLRVLKEYKIRLRYKEFAHFFFGLCDLFLEYEGNNFFKQTTKLNYYLFHTNHFRVTSEMDKESKKTAFLYQTFSMLSNTASITNDFDNLLLDLNIMTEDKIIQKEIVNYQKLVEDAIIEHIINNIIKVNIDSKIDQSSLEIIIDITNDGNYVFQDFNYELTWKPRNRINLENVEELNKSRDLHDRIKSKNIFSVQTNGIITIFCSISFQNPLNSHKRLQKDLKLTKIDLK